MKARDIIPDWPRGTSTSKPYAEATLLLITFLRCWSPRDLAMLEDEVDSDLRYHEGQVRMMDEWRTKTGQYAPPDERFNHLYTPMKGFSGEPTVSEMVNKRMEKASQQLTEELMFGRPYYEPLEDHTWPTYGGITRTNSLAPPWPWPAMGADQDGSIFTLEKLLAYAKAMPKFPRLPPYYRCHPITYQEFKRAMPGPPGNRGIIQFVGLSIHQDTAVPLGEFWPPEGWKADAD